MNGYNGRGKYSSHFAIRWPCSRPSPFTGGRWLPGTRHWRAFPSPFRGSQRLSIYWKLTTVDRKVLIPAAWKVVSYTHGAFLYLRLLLALSGTSGNASARLLDPLTARNTAPLRLLPPSPAKSIDEFNYRDFSREHVISYLTWWARLLHYISSAPRPL